MPRGSDDPDNSDILCSQPIQDQTTKTNGVSSGHSNTQNVPSASVNPANTQTNLALVKRNKGRPAKEEANCVTKGYKELNANKCRQITRHFMRDVKRDEKDLVARAKRGEDQLTKASIPKIRVFSKVGTVYDKNGKLRKPIKVVTKLDQIQQNIQFACYKRSKYICEQVFKDRTINRLFVKYAEVIKEEGPFNKKASQ